ncbi:MAG: hypothetical protein ACFE7R_03365 [Candidatus Hodarchaeota archaeon]
MWIMVSRSLEKMILIAIGLTTAVLVGIPILMYSMSSLEQAALIEEATLFAETLHNATDRVDKGLENDTGIPIQVPNRVSVSSSNTVLTVTLERDEGSDLLFSVAYDHVIDLIPPASAGDYWVFLRLVDDSLQVHFLAVP